MKKRTIAEMLAGERIVELSPSASVREASLLMAKEHVGAVLVCVEDRLEGIFTERDALSRVLAQHRNPETTQLSEVMTRNPLTIRRQAAAIEALRLMRNGGFRHLPVVDNGRVVGVVSLRDFCGAELAEIEDELDFQSIVAEGTARRG
ncbi:MAG: CBS domain-containing protein [Kiloniellales bacterium]|nr:CBS domain-containing protein [Kiloniellales bacterium]